MSTAPAGSPAIRPLILIASSSADEHEMYAAYFASSGFRVATTTRGDEAITHALALKPAVVLASTHLPGQDGLEVCRAISALCVPVILLASAPVQQNFPCTAVMLRPALPDAVMAAVERLLTPQ
jgi:CheY-like chemotaxis protein